MNVAEKLALLKDRQAKEQATEDGTIVKLLPKKHQKCSFCNRKAVSEGSIRIGKKIFIAHWCKMDEKEFTDGLEDIRENKGPHRFNHPLATA